MYVVTLSSTLSPKN